MRDERVGTVIDGRFLLEEVLGDEYAGRVYRARETTTGRKVRLKLPRPEDLLAANGERIRRFNREIEAFSRVRSPGLLPLLETGTHEGLVYAIFPGLPERTLQRVVDAGILEPQRATEVVAKVAVAVAALHREGIVHRDLVAANVLIDAKDEVHVRDLGLASFVSVEDATDSLTDEGQRVGHVASMAPEYLADEEVKPTADLYALGVLLFQLLTGHPPFAGKAGELIQLHLTTRPPAPSTLAPDIPPWLDALVAALLDKDPRRRPAPDAVIARIRKGWGTGEARPAQADDDDRPPFDWGRLLRPLAAVLGAAVVLVSLGAVGGLVLKVLLAEDPGLDAGTATLPTEVVVPAGPTDGEAAPRAPEARPEAPSPAVSPRPRPPPTGTLTVKANRRALVFVDDALLGYTPVEVKLPVGRHHLSAALPGRTDSRQERDVVVREATPAAVTLVF